MTALIIISSILTYLTFFTLWVRIAYKTPAFWTDYQYSKKHFYWFLAFVSALVWPTMLFGYFVAKVAMYTPKPKLSKETTPHPCYCNGGAKECPPKTAYR